MRETKTKIKSLLLKNPQNILESELYDKIWEDLHLNQIISYISKDLENKEIVEYFYKPLKDLEEIEYRHEIFKELLNNNTLFNILKNFVEEMDVVKRELNFSDKLEYRYNKEGWWLEALNKYINTVTKLEKSLSTINIISEGLNSFYAYLKNYIQSEDFSNLTEKFQQVKKELEDVVYCIHIDGLRVIVYKYEKDEEYEEDIVKTFNNFKNLFTKEYEVKIPIKIGMNHVENEIIENVAKIYPYPFEILDSFYKENYEFFDPLISQSSEELKFYISYINFMNLFREAGLDFCFPYITTDKDKIYIKDAFDLALAYEKLKKNDIVVVNDLELNPNERIVIVTGPNQGGKTTFARMVGEIFYLSKLGVPVPGREARIFLWDNIFTHFEREENVQTLKGKLEMELTEIKEILNKATPLSLIILNETFSSATMSDALFLAKEIINRILKIDCSLLYVTFLEDLINIAKEKTVSMVAAVSKEDPSIKTFKIIKKPADGKAYAVLLAEKYKLTYEHLKERWKK